MEEQDQKTVKLWGKDKIKKATIKDVAKLAGLSMATVSYILGSENNDVPFREETRRRVLEAAQQLQYVPNLVAKSLKTGNSKRIGILMWKSSTVMLADPYFSKILDGLHFELDLRGYQMSIVGFTQEQSSSTTQRLETTLSKGNIDGLAIVGAITDEMDQLIPSDIVRAYIMAKPKALRDNIHVGIDDEFSMRRIVQYLVNLGHRRIAYVGSANPNEISSCARERFSAYKSFLQDAGVAVIPELLRDCDGWGDASYSCVQSLLRKKPLPTAIIAMNDIIAVLAIKACHDYGLEVPRDISVTGFGDIDLVEHIFPPLTTSRIPLREIGKKAAEELTNRVVDKRRRNAKTVLLQSELIVRKSSGPPSPTDVSLDNCVAYR